MRSNPDHLIYYFSMALGAENEVKFAGPCAQGVLDTVIVPCPMSLGCTGLIDSTVLFKDNAFLGTSAHESVTLVGYLPAPRRLLVDSRCVSRPFLGLYGCI